MTHEQFEAIELGQAEALIEICLPVTDEEVVDKFTPGAVPYVEFE